ncbi:MAG: hypothetical protein GXP25_08355 [Planctomycetes bacterium]|nr:hypothetical protein [Planctomycetota bacterium]
MKSRNRLLCLLACLSLFALPFAVLAGEDNKPKENKKDEGSADKTKDVKKGTDEPGKADVPKEKEKVERGIHGNPVESGLRKRWGYRERMAEALRKAEEKKKRKHEEWLADEERRREAIRRVREERAAQKKKRAAEAKEKGHRDDFLLPPEKLATITMKSGCSFKGVIMTETKEEITVKIKGGEMTIDKRLISSIDRPPEPEKKQEKTLPAQK